jgi:hypothetical protein
VTGLWVEELVFEFWQVLEIFVFYKMFTPALGLFDGDWPIRDDLSPPFGTELKNGWSYTSTPRCMFSWCGQGKVNIIVTFIVNV